MEVFETTGEKGTQELGERLAKKIPGGTLLCLFGELASGKTTFVQGLARGLGIDDTVNSPTFNIMKLYAVKDELKTVATATRLYHVDCYRIDHEQEMRDLGWEEWIRDPKGVVAAEWSEKIPGLLPKERIEIRFKIAGNNKRRIEVSSLN